MARDLTFKRLVLGFHGSTMDSTALQLAGDLADLLGLDLLGLFMADIGISNLAGLPFARELRSLGGGWCAIDPGRLEHELELSARSAERLFDDLAKRLRSTCRFHVIKGSPANILAEMWEAGDIVMLADPATPAERMTHPFAALADAALASPASVLMVPRRVLRPRGPVVAIAVSRDDPSVEAAIAIAATANEDAVVLRLHDGDDASPRARELATESGVTLRVKQHAGPLVDAGSIVAAFAGIRERLIVLTRTAISQDTPSLIAASRGVPVLVLEPAKQDGMDAAGDRGRNGMQADRH